MTNDTLSLLQLSLARWCTYLGLVGLTGSIIVRWLLSRNRWPQDNKSLENTHWSIAVYGAVLLICAAGARLYAQTYSVFGLDQSVTLESLRIVGLDSRWGARWQPHAILSLITIISVLMAKTYPRVGWRTTGILIAALWSTSPMTGHAMAFQSILPWTIQIAHGLAAGLWVGSLFVILISITRLTTSSDGHQRLADIIQRFSLLARVSVTTLIITGALTVWFYIDTFEQLWTTSYGRMLLVKMGLVIATGGLGLYNWRWLTPQLRSDRSAGKLVQVAKLETVCALLLLAATALLVHLAMPHDL
jgi:putative copper export protein|tara:strand:+ start:161 stop:1069 length:909 start_codon:yes stop_codon:yes gene_type:complete